MFEQYLNSVVIVDTDGPFCFLGELSESNGRTLTLREVGIYDRRSAHAEYELFLIEAAKYGHAVSRHETMIPVTRVLAVSRLADIVQV